MVYETTNKKSTSNRIRFEKINAGFKDFWLIDICWKKTHYIYSLFKNSFNIKIKIYLHNNFLKKYIKSDREKFDKFSELFRKKYKVYIKK